MLHLPQTTRSRILLGLAGLAVMLAVAWLVLGPAEREYRGKTLREWARQSAVGETEEIQAALRQFGPEAVPELVRLLGGKDPAWRSGFRKVVLSLPGPLRRGMLRRLELPAEATRPSFARALGLLGPAAYRAAPDLAAALHSGDSALAGEAARALARIGPAGVAELIHGLDHNDATVRMLAADALGHAGPEAEFALPALVRHLADSDPKTRAAVSATLAKIRPRLVRELSAVFAADDEQARQAALRVLGQRHLELQLIAPAVRKLLESSDPVTRKDAVLLLARINPGDLDSVSVISRALRDPDPAVRVAAAQALGRVIGPTTEAVAGLEGALDDASPGVLAAAVAALGQAGAVASPTLPRLRALANHPEEAVRKAAAEAAKKIGNPD